MEKQKRYFRNLKKGSVLALAALFSLILLIFASRLIFTTPGNSNIGTTYIKTQNATVSFYVDPSGNDSNDGRSAKTPFKTIQKAVDLAQAGEKISLASGIYREDFVTRRDGQTDSPIIIAGPTDAIVKGGGNTRIIEINHDYIVLEGFTVDGHFGEKERLKDYRKKLIYAQGNESRAGVTGLKILGMTIKNSAGECIRLRYFAQGNEIAGNTIENCGIEDFRFDGGGKNGEGIYIGTAPEQIGDGKNPTEDPDGSSGNWIHNNNIDTQGNECVDIKESSWGNIVENNKCTGQKDEDAAGMSSRGRNNIFRYNEIFGNTGAGVRLGGDGILDGIGNSVYENVIKGNESGGVKIQRFPQGKICANIMSENKKDNSAGIFSKLFNPTADCAQ